MQLFDIWRNIDVTMTMILVAIQTLVFIVFLNLICNVAIAKNTRAQTRPSRPSGPSYFDRLKGLRHRKKKRLPPGDKKEGVEK